MKAGYRFIGSEIPAIGNDELKLEARLMELEQKGYKVDVEDIRIDGEQTGFRIKLYEKIQIA